MEAVWSHLGRLLGCLGGLLGGLVFQKRKNKQYQIHVFKSFDLAMFALLERFGRPSWLILGFFGPPKEVHKSLKTVPKISLFVFVVFLIIWGTILGSILGPKSP